MACESAVGWTDIVTWCLVLAGWYVVHRQELSRELRKENLEEVTHVIEEIKSLESDAIAFHTSEYYSEEASSSLTWRVQRLNRRFQRSPLDCLEIPVQLMVRFKKALTLENSDPSSFARQDYHGPLIVRIRQLADEFIDTVEAARDREIK